MKILYLSNHDMRVHNGVVNKITAQVHEWSKHGEEVIIFSTVGFKVFDSNLNELESYSRLYKILSRTGPLRFIFIHICSLIAAKKINPDIIYSRYFLFSPFFTILSFNFPLVIEINGNDQVELRNSKPLLYFYNELTRDFTFLSTKGLVFVSKELEILFEKFHKKSLVVPNGVHPFLNNKEDIINKIVSNGRTNVGFSGTASQSWHGLDKILPLFAENTDLHLHVIGADGENTRNVTYYGRVDSQMNQKILNSCSACLSTLALHRTNINEASPLKSREYVLLGKRILYAYEDADLDVYSNDYPNLFCKISNNESNVIDSQAKILTFLRARPEVLFFPEIRKIGLDVLTYDKKESKRLSFFNLVQKS